jgi:hypothetical protein
MGMIAGRVRNFPSSSLIEPDALSVSHAIAIAKPPQVESHLRLQPNTPSTFGCPVPIINKEKRKDPQEELGENVRLNNNFNKISNRHDIVQGIPISCMEEGKNTKTTAEYKETIKNDKATKVKEMVYKKQVNFAKTSIQKESKKLEIITPRKRRFVVKKVVHRFSAVEDEMLKKLVKAHGEGYWSLIAKKMPGLNRKQIRDRYVNYLKKTRLDTAFTAEEDTTILRLVKEKGKCWSSIAEELVGRTPIMVKNHFYSSLLPILNNKSDCISPILSHKNTKEKKILNKKIYSEEEGKEVN